MVKERARSTICILPYKLLPKLVLIKLMHVCVMWMNSFPVKLGISEKWSPREIVSRHKLDAKMHCKVPFGAYCEVHVNPVITNTMEPRTRWGICLRPTGNMQGSYKFLSLSTRNKVTQRKFTEMPMTDSVIRMVDSLGKKEQCKNGVSFKNRKGEEYTFDNEDEYEMIAEAKILAPFPDIAAEAPGMLTKREEMIGVNEVIQSEPEPSNKEQAMLAAANSEIDFSLPPEDQPNRGEIIEILDDKDDDIIDQYMKEESTQQLYKDKLPKIEEDRVKEVTPKETIKHDNEYQHSKQNRIANRQYQDYELYVTVEEEDRLDNEDDPKKMASMAHYIMMHFAKKESIKKKQKKKYKPKAGHYSLEAELKHFGERGETAASKELKQVNLYMCLSLSMPINYLMRRS